MKIGKTIFILILFISCSDQDVNVNLEMESGWKKEFNTFYEIGSEIPYTGTYVSESINGNVTIDFKNGKMDGDFIHLNNEGDTTEYRIYKNGRKTFQLDIQYEDDEVIHRGTQKETTGSIEDEQIFEKVKALIISNDYYKLGSFLNSPGSYKSELNSLTNQFGRIDSIEIMEITNEFNSYNKREELRVQMKFNYEDIQLQTSLLVVRDSTGEIDGQGFGVKPVNTDLLPDNKIDEVIDILLNKDVDKYLSIRDLDNGHREEMKDYLNDIGSISSDYKFLKTKVWPLDKMIFIKYYLIEIDGEKQILQLWHLVESKYTLNFNIFHITPYRSKFEVMHY